MNLRPLLAAITAITVRVAAVAFAPAPATAEVAAQGPSADPATSPATAAPAPRPVTVYHGRAGDLEVTVPTTGADFDIDGVLDEAAWGDAALLTGFSQYEPVDGAPAVDSTEVRVLYDEYSMYFGVRAWEPHGGLVATLADRDRIAGNDHVQIMLDSNVLNDPWPRPLDPDDEPPDLRHQGQGTAATSARWACGPHRGLPARRARRRGGSQHASSATPSRSTPGSATTVAGVTREEILEALRESRRGRGEEG